MVRLSPAKLTGHRIYQPAQSNAPHTSGVTIGPIAEGRSCGAIAQLQHLPHHPSRPFRVVVETDDPTLAISDFASFAAAGFGVVCCGGPSDDHPCPVVEGRPCPLVEDSDVVLNQFKDHETQHTVLDGVHRTSPDVPMVVTVAAQWVRVRPAGWMRPSGTVYVSQRTDASRSVELSLGGANPTMSDSDGDGVRSSGDVQECKTFM